MQVLLHGGYGGFWKRAGQDTAFFQRLINAANLNDKKILISFLAQESLAEFPCLDEMLKTFNQLDSSVSVNIADRDNFKDLLPDHSVLFMQGGDSLAHQEFLRDVSAEELKQNKRLMAGSSSGSSMLCHHGFTDNGGQPIQGKGIVDIAVIPHANSWPIEEYSSKLRSVTKSPIILLEEMQFCELHVD